MSGSLPTRWIVFFICGALSAFGCVGDTDTPQGETGALSLNLELGDTDIEKVHWTISRSGMPDMDGDINTSAPGATASVEVFGLPPGPGYTVTLKAIATDGETVCAGSENFSVDIGEVTGVEVFLRCKGPERFGSVRVNGEFNVCAYLYKVVVSPLETSVGHDIDVSAIAVDEESDAIEYRWSNDLGAFGDPTAQVTTYTCGEVGTHEITITITDDGEPCEDSWTVPVECVLGEVECILNSDCDDGQQCTVNGCDEGRCITADVDIGESCDQDGGTVCDGDGNCVECNTNPDCDTGFVCEANMCVEEAECELDAQCDDGMQCTLNTCVLGACVTTDSDPGDTCDEGGGTVCDGAGVCVECNDNPDCDTGFVCEANMCVEEAECELDAQCDDGMQCTLNTCVLGACVTTDSDPGDTCDEGGGTVCDGAGVCVECNDNPDCDTGFVCEANMCVEEAECELDAQCDDGMQCTVNTCVLGACVTTDSDPGDTCDEGGGTVCDGAGVCVECNNDGQCGAGQTCTDNMCVSGPVDLPPVTKAIEIACNNSAQPQMSAIPTELTVDPGLTLGGSPFTADLTGLLNFPESFLDVATGVLPANTTQAQITGLVATVKVRSGATGSNVAIGVDPALPAACALTTTTCNPANNVCRSGGNTGNPCSGPGDCGGAVCNDPVCIPIALDTCGSIVDLPLSFNENVCAVLEPGRTCQGGSANGSACTDDIQCPGAVGTVRPCENVNKLLQLTNFGGCVTGDLPLPLGTETGTYTAGPSGSQMLFGWIDDQGTGGSALKMCPDAGNAECYSTTSNCELGESVTPVCAYDGPYTDGTNTYWSLPKPLFNDPIGALGIKLNAGLLVGIECVMGKDVSRPECEGLCENGTNDGTACPGGDIDCTGGGICGLADPSCGCFNNECGAILGETQDSDLIDYTAP